MTQKQHGCISVILWVAISLLSACSTVSLLLGTEKPVDQKSKAYQIKDLSQGTSDWLKLDFSKSDDHESPMDSPDSVSTRVSDVAYVSRKDASVISLNSSCGSALASTDLRKSSDIFFYGMTDVTYRQELPTVVQNIPALQTTRQGKLYRDPDSKILRTVVFRGKSCLFDFVYLATPAEFSRNEEVFSSFISSFKLRN